MSPTQTEWMRFLGPILLVVGAAVSLVTGKTLSVWPVDGRILDGRTAQPHRYWLSVGFYVLMAAFALWTALVHPAEAPAKSSTDEPTSALVAFITVVGIGLNVVYFWMKAKAADKTAWRRFWFIGWVLLLTFLMCPELLDLRLPSPVWKLALIPLLALAFSSFNVAVSGAFGGSKKS
jgi:hypothetical protein